MNKVSYSIKFSIKLIIFSAIFLMVAFLLLSVFHKITPVRRVFSETVSASTRKNKQKLTIVIDAGHGGEDGGAVSKDGVFEKDLNLDIAKKLEDMFISAGINVILTRKEDVLLYDKDVDYHGRKKVLDLARRLEIAQNTENPVFISIHMNSFPIQKYKGLQVYYSQNDKHSFLLADIIQNDAKTNIDKSNDRKIKAGGSNIYLLNNMNFPSVLVECGFLSNPEETSLLKTDKYRQKIAFSIFSSTLKYIDSYY